MTQALTSEFYKNILNRINSNIYITDIDTDKIVYMNDYMKHTFHLQNPEGETCWKILQCDMTGRCPFCKIEQLKSTQRNSACVWKEKNTITGRIYMNCDSLIDWDGKQYHIQNSIDITDQILLSMEASIDELTGILNRNAGKKRLEDMLKNMTSEDKLAVALCDINGLKWVNDTYGHMEGDKLLVFFAQNVHQELQDSDFIFRLSGDEFVIVFVNKETAQLETWMQHMLEKLKVRRTAKGITYDVSFSYGLASIYAGEHLNVSDVLSIVDTQMYIQKRDHHIKMGQERLQQDRRRQTNGETLLPFQYNKDYLFDALSESIDDYLFVGNLKTGKFMYSYKMMVDFGLPSQILSNAAAFWGEKVHPDDMMMFLRSNQEIADGRAEQHAITYRAKNVNGTWSNLLCKGKMIRDESGQPDLFAGTIRNLDKYTDMVSDSDNSSSFLQSNDIEQFVVSEIFKNHFPFAEERKAETPDKNADSQALLATPKVLFYFLEQLPEAEQLKIEQKLQNFINQYILDGFRVAYIKPQMPLFCFNQAVLDFTQYTYQEFMETCNGYFSHIIHPDDREMVEQSISEQLKNNQFYSLRYRILRKDTTSLWIYERGSAVINEYGEQFILSFLFAPDEQKLTE